MQLEIELNPDGAIILRHKGTFLGKIELAESGKPIFFLAIDEIETVKLDTIKKREVN